MPPQRHFKPGTNGREAERRIERVARAPKTQRILGLIFSAGQPAPVGLAEAFWQPTPDRYGRSRKRLQPTCVWKLMWGDLVHEDVEREYRWCHQNVGTTPFGGNRPTPLILVGNYLGGDFDPRRYSAVFVASRRAILQTLGGTWQRIVRIPRSRLPPPPLAP